MFLLLILLGYPNAIRIYTRAYADSSSRSTLLDMRAGHMGALRHKRPSHPVCCSPARHMSLLFGTYVPAPLSTEMSIHLMLYAVTLIYVH